MARKRQKLQEIDYMSKEYWNRLLAEDGCSLSQGRNPKLTYVGNTTDITTLQETRLVRGRKLPKKQAE